MPHLVVAHYREDLSWLKQLDVPRTIYTKGGGLEGIPLFNQGRETHTYLYHILQNYHDNLAPVTIFSQGHPEPHVPNWRVNFVHDYKQFTPFGKMYDDDHLGRPHHSEHCQGRPSHVGGIPVGECYRELIGEPVPRKFRFCGGAMFAVTDKEIRRRSFEFWEKAMDYVKREDRAPWVFERLWQYLFCA
jgi:hypothetical protein